MASPLPVFGEKLREMTGPYRARNPRLVALLRLSDALGRILRKRAGATASPERPMKILLANWGHLGDVVAILPLLNFIEQNPAVLEVSVLIGSWSRGVLEASGSRARIFTIDHPLLDRRPVGRGKKIWNYLKSIPPLVRDLRRAGYTVSVDGFSTFPATHALTWMAGIPCRIGFTSAGFGASLTHPVLWQPADISVADQQLRLLEPLFGKERPTALPALYPGFRPVALPAFGVDAGAYVVLHRGAGDPMRSWPESEWIELARALRDKGFQIVLSGASEAEVLAAQAIADQTGAVNAAGRLSWPQFVTLVSKAKAVIAIDTVIGHVAACFAIPTVVLTAGRQRLAFWKPNNPRALALTYPVGCYPCNRTNGCPQMACLRRIGHRDVLSAFHEATKSAIPPSNDIEITG
ncbi:MAG: glycosyltransferase family 9 protein [Alphaproteobacteria bacterium]|nr:glycosyltransferase family 9 protein [Alphaproteobacteria bacterium]